MYSLIIAKYNQFIGTGSTCTPIPGKLDTVDIDTRTQTTASTDFQIPIYSNRPFCRHSSSYRVPQLSPRHIIKVNCQIHLTIATVMGNDKRGCGRSRILRADNTDFILTNISSYIK